MINVKTTVNNTIFVCIAALSIVLTSIVVASSFFDYDDSELEIAVIELGNNDEMDHENDNFDIVYSVKSPTISKKKTNRTDALIFPINNQPLKEVNAPPPNRV